MDVRTAGWTTGSREARLVVAWLTSCDSVNPTALSRLNAVLSGEERARASRFRFARDQLSFCVAHALVRLMLSVLLPRPPQAWEFTADRFGRPRLRPGQTRDAVCFSLSHTNGLAACAVGVGHQIGIDGENREAVRLLDLDGDWLTEAESAELHTRGPEARGGAAVELWTLKEAVAKATGLGLHQRLGDVGFTLEPPRLVRSPLACAGRWWFAQMNPTPMHAVAVAVRSASRAPVPIAIEMLSADALDELATPFSKHCDHRAVSHLFGA